jgi:hypothetical protein
MFPDAKILLMSGYTHEPELLHTIPELDFLPNLSHFRNWRKGCVQRWTNSLLKDRLLLIPALAFAFASTNAQLVAKNLPANYRG